MQVSVDTEKSGRILIVDDYPDIRTLLERAVLRDGHEVILAPDAETALELLEEAPVHVVLADIELPKMDGLALTEQIKEKNPSTEVIVVTGHATMEHVSKALRLGAFDGDGCQRTVLRYLCRILGTGDGLRGEAADLCVT